MLNSLYTRLADPIRSATLAAILTVLAVGVAGAVPWQLYADFDSPRDLNLLNIGAYEDGLASPSYSAAIVESTALDGPALRLEVWDNGSNAGDRAYALFNDPQSPGCPLAGLGLDLWLGGSSGGYMYWDVYFGGDSLDDFFNCYDLLFEIRPDANRISLTKWVDGESVEVLDQVAGLDLQLGDVYHVDVDMVTRTATVNGPGANVTLSFAADVTYSSGTAGCGVSTAGVETVWGEFDNLKLRSACDRDWPGAGDFATDFAASDALDAWLASGHEEGQAHEDFGFDWVDSAAFGGGAAQLEVSNHATNSGDMGAAFPADATPLSRPLLNASVSLYTAYTSGGYGHWGLFFASQSNIDPYNGYELAVGVRPDHDYVILLKWEDWHSVLIDSVRTDISLGSIYDLSVDMTTRTAQVSGPGVDVSLSFAGDLSYRTGTAGFDVLNAGLETVRGEFDDFAMAWGEPDSPEIFAVDDVPGDQGRQLRLSWHRSAQDSPDTAFEVTEYGIWRKIGMVVLGGGDRVYPPGEWDFVGTVPARGEEIYQTVVPSLCDSTAEGVCYSSYFISARTPDPLTYFDSTPGFGISQDNLAPPAPLDLRMAGPDLLAWNAADAPDVSTYRIYVSATSEGQFDFYGETGQLEYSLGEDTHGQYLAVTTVDHAGNEGPLTDAVAWNGTPVDPQGLPSAVALLPNYPNPFNPKTSVRFALPTDSSVDLAIYDMTGRRVRSLLAGKTLPAGEHAVNWDGCDDSGTAMASGIYFARLTTPERVESRKMSLLK